MIPPELLSAHEAQIIELPETVVAAIAMRRDLDAALSASIQAGKAATIQASAARKAAIERLLDSGAFGQPGKEEIELLEVARRHKADSVPFASASARARDREDRALLGEADAIHASLEQALLSTLDAARADAPALRSIRWEGGVDVIHDSPQPAQRAYHALQPLAARHDAIRQAAAALHAYVGRALAHQTDRDGLIAATSPDTFAGGGLLAPRTRSLDGSVSTDWKWAPGGGDPVKRLVDACLGPVPETREQRLAAKAKAAEAKAAARAAEPVQPRVPIGRVATRRCSTVR